MEVDETRGAIGEMKAGLTYAVSRLSGKVAAPVGFLDSDTPSRCPMRRIRVYVWLSLMLQSGDDEQAKG